MNGGVVKSTFKYLFIGLFSYGKSYITIEKGLMSSHGHRRLEREKIKHKYTK